MIRAYPVYVRCPLSFYYVFQYSGDYKIIDDDGNAIKWKQASKITFKPRVWPKPFINIQYIKFNTRSLVTLEISEQLIVLQLNKVRYTVPS